MSKPMDNPCYDRVNKIDCPRRKGGCSVDCPDWAKYIEEREKMYKERAIEYESRAVVFETGNRNRTKKLRKDIHMRHSKSTHRD